MEQHTGDSRTVLKLKIRYRLTKVPVTCSLIIAQH